MQSVLDSTREAAEVQSQEQGEGETEPLLVLAEVLQNTSVSRRMDGWSETSYIRLIQAPTVFWLPDFRNSL